MSALQEKIDSLSELTPKQLRTLRNSLNNRIESMLTKGEEGVKALAPSHRLYGLELVDCRALLKQVRLKLKEL